MNSNTLKFIGAAALLGTWGAFAFFGKTPVDGFIAAIGAALSGLGIYHVSTTASSTASSQSAPVPQQVQAPAPEASAPAVPPAQ